MNFSNKSTKPAKSSATPIRTQPQQNVVQKSVIQNAAQIVKQRVQATIQRTHQMLQQVRLAKQTLNAQNQSHLYADKYKTNPTKPINEQKKYKSAKSVNATFDKKDSDDTSKDAGMAEHPFESTSRRIALKVGKMVLEDGWAGLPINGTPGTSQEGGADPINSNDTKTYYKLKKRGTGK